MYVGEYALCVWVPKEARKRVSGPRELELQDIELSPAPMWVLVTGLRSS